MHDYHLSGSADELGRQYARRLADAGRSLASASPEPLDPPADKRAFARECAKHVEAHAPFLLEELRGIAAEAGVDPEPVETVPLALDARAGCSLVAVSGECTADGRALLARNHDFYPSFRPYATRYRTDPADGLASVGCSCVFVGRCDGVNEAGLAIGFAEVPPHEFEPGFAWQLAIRATLDTCRTVDDAVSFLESIPHATNVNFLLADAGGEVALVEASPERVASSRPSDEIVTVTRRFPTESMREYQSTDPSVDHYCSRLDEVEAWLEDRERPITVEDLRTAMSDPDIGACWPVDEERDDPRSTIWSWVMDPADYGGSLAGGSPIETAYEPVTAPGR